MRRTGPIAIGLLVFIGAPACAQSLAGSDDSINHRIASAVRASIVRIAAMEHAVRDPLHSGSTGFVFTGESLLTPYRSGASTNIPNGFTWQLPGTSFALTNGSAWFRRASDGDRRRGAGLSVQLSYR